MTRFESQVREKGVDCRVEVRERLAILIPGKSRDSRFSVDERRQVLLLAKDEGLTHVAVELDPDVAALPGD